MRGCWRRIEKTRNLGTRELRELGKIDAIYRSKPYWAFLGGLSRGWQKSGKGNEKIKPFIDKPH